MNPSGIYSFKPIDHSRCCAFFYENLSIHLTTIYHLSLFYAPTKTQETTPVTEFSLAFFRVSIYWNLLFQLTFLIDL
jgi:hypothetical protein